MQHCVFVDVSHVEESESYLYRYDIHINKCTTLQKKLICIHKVKIYTIYIYANSMFTYGDFLK